MRRKEIKPSLVRQLSMPTLGSSQSTLINKSPERSPVQRLPILRKSGSPRKTTKKHVRIVSLGNDSAGLFEDGQKTFLEQLTERFADGYNKSEVRKNDHYVIFGEIKPTGGHLPDARVSGTMVMLNSFLYLYGGQGVDHGQSMKILNFRQLY